VTVNKTTAFEDEEVGVGCWAVVGVGDGLAGVEGFWEAEEGEDEGS
jgi:hypothetical protein